MMSRSEIHMSLSEIYPNLYLSGSIDMNVSKLTEYGITHAVDASNWPGNLKSPNVDYFYIYIADSEDVDIKKYFVNAGKFINEAREAGGKVLVFCMAGISRSTTILLAYLMQYENLCLRDAYYKVLDARRIIDPNNGFWKQLIQFENELRGESTVTMLKYVPDVYKTKKEYQELGGEFFVKADEIEDSNDTVEFSNR